MRRRHHTLKTLGALVALTAASAAWSLDLGVTKGVGPDGFTTTGAEQFTGSLRWHASPRVPGTLSYRHIVDDISTVKGGDIALGAQF